MHCLSEAVGSYLGYCCYGTVHGYLIGRALQYYGYRGYI